MGVLSDIYYEGYEEKKLYNSKYFIHKTALSNETNQFPKSLPRACVD